ncbi:hypothetical protein FACS1894202_01280 [Clostridia bacterium]|nr:hypothetical protein FACS1894202_01280 [Clostridia bacterium]
MFKITCRALSLVIALATVVSVAVFAPTTASAATYTAKDLGVKAIGVFNSQGLATYTISTSEYDGSVQAVVDATGKAIIKDTEVFYGSLWFDELGYALADGKLYDKSGKVTDFTKIADTGPGLLDYAGGIILDQKDLDIYDVSGKKLGNARPSNLDERYMYVWGEDSLGDKTRNVGENGYITLWFYDSKDELPDYCVLTDKYGKVIYEGSDYTNVGRFSDGLVWAYKYGKEPDTYELLYIDSTGKEVISLGVRDAAYNFFRGRAIINQGGYNGAYGAIDKTGKTIIPIVWEDIYLSTTDIYAVKKDGKWGVIDKSQKTLVAFDYDGCFGFGDSDIAAIGKDGKFGYVDSKGNDLVPFEYDDISTYSNGVGYGIKGGKLYAITLNDVQAQTAVPSSWATASVEKASALGLATVDLTDGYQTATTRAEFCRAAVNFLRKYGYDVDGVTPKLFADTSDKDIGIAAALGITSGTDTAKNLFSPDGTLTREQAATMLRNVMNVIGAKYDTAAVKWTDARDISSWAQTAADVMYSAKVMGGTSTTALVFSPKTPYTHEQSIITLVNLWEYVKK